LGDLSLLELAKSDIHRSRIIGVTDDDTRNDGFKQPIHSQPD
jgi:hypothetical protein